MRNLARLKMLTDEMLMRASTEEQLGFTGDLGLRFDQSRRGGRIILVEDRDACAERIMDALWLWRRGSCQRRGGAYHAPLGESQGRFRPQRAPIT